MSKVTGIIEKAHQNDAGFYSILVDGKWYGTYRDDFTHLEGKTVEFESSTKGRFLNANKVKPVAEEANKATPRAAPAGDRQQSIVLQSSYKTAADFLGSLIAADKIGLGAKKDALDTGLDALDAVALRIYRNCIDPAEFVADPEDPTPAKAAEGEWDPTEA